MHNAMSIRLNITEHCEEILGQILFDRKSIEVQRCACVYLTNKKIKRIRRRNVNDPLIN